MREKHLKVGVRDHASDRRGPTCMHKSLEQGLHLTFWDPELRRPAIPLKQKICTDALVLRMSKRSVYRGAHHVDKEEMSVLPCMHCSVRVLEGKWL